MKQELRVFDNPVALARGAALELGGRAESAVRASGRFTLVLSGGNTPRLLYRELARPEYRHLPWGACHVFWGDERTVPADHPESNFRMAHEELLSRLPIPSEHVHRMRGEDPSPGHAAAQYELTMMRCLGLADGVLPRFDLVLLGLGRDGHTASVFPGRPEVTDSNRHLAVAVHVDAAMTWRLSLTLGVINNAACVMFLVAGDDKAEVLQAVLEGDRAGERLPAQAVEPRDGTLLWLVDAGAARRLGGASSGRSDHPPASRRNM